MPDVFGIKQSAAIRRPTANEIWSRCYHAIGMASTPVMSDKIDGTTDIFKLLDEPLGITRLSRVPACWGWRTKARWRKQNNIMYVATCQLSHNEAPDCAGLWVAVYKNLCHFGIPLHNLFCWGQKL